MLERRGTRSLRHERGLIQGDDVACLWGRITDGARSGTKHSNDPVFVHLYDALDSARHFLIRESFHTIYRLSIGIFFAGQQGPTGLRYTRLTEPRKEIRMSTPIENIAVTRNDGGAATLGDYTGRVRLVVNVASKCGLTPQYEGLERLYEEKRAAGLEVLAFPANNFKGQEPGTDAEILDFCTTQYNVTFPLFAKLSALGDDRHPLYTALVEAQPAAIGEGPFRERLKGFGVVRENPADVLWNFEKFLIGRNGQVVARFSPDVKADDPRLVAAIDAELAK